MAAKASSSLAWRICFEWRAADFDGLMPGRPPPLHDALFSTTVFYQDILRQRYSRVIAWRYLDTAILSEVSAADAASGQVKLTAARFLGRGLSPRALARELRRIQRSPSSFLSPPAAARPFIFLRRRLSDAQWAVYRRKRCTGGFLILFQGELFRQVISRLSQA